MARRRKSPFAKFKAWPILLSLAGVYFAKENLGIQNAAGLNELSAELMPFLLLAFAAAVVLLILRMRAKRRNDTDRE